MASWLALLAFTGCRPVARIDFGGVRRAGPPKSGPFGPKKWTFLNLTPLTLLQKPHFWPTLWLKVDLLADLGGASHPPATPLATGLTGCVHTWRSWNEHQNVYLKKCWLRIFALFQINFIQSYFWITYFCVKMYMGSLKQDLMNLMESWLALLAFTGCVRTWRSWNEYQHVYLQKCCLWIFRLVARQINSACHQMLILLV